MSEFITDLTIEQVKELIAASGEPAYRAKQLSVWVYQRLAVSWDEMSDLPAAFRQKLAAKIQFHALTPVQGIKAKDGTIKMLFSLPDGKTVETALMKFYTGKDDQAVAAEPLPIETDGQERLPGSGKAKFRYTVCISTQVGCPIACPFCATGQQGFERNLTAGEIIDQVLYFARLLQDRSKGKEPEKIDNIVFMGMGEPFANYEAVWQAVEMLNAPSGFGLGARSMTISSAGLVPGIKRLSEEKLQVGLAISLHAADNKLRDDLVPVNKKYPLGELISACREYVNSTGRRISFEYAMFAGVNDSVAQADLLSDLIRGLNCHVNLICANNVAGQALQSSPRKQVDAFKLQLESRGITCTIRQSRGQDIDAGCGQLRSRFLTQKSR
jgi:23S rRNA (adenine2503-C2)-methyltransferase